MEGREKMGVLIKLSGYVSKRNVAIVMTYLYILTFLVLIASQMRLSKDIIFDTENGHNFLKRSLMSYVTQPSNNHTSLLTGQEGEKLMKFQRQRHALASEVDVHRANIQGRKKKGKKHSEKGLVKKEKEKVSKMEIDTGYAGKANDINRGDASEVNANVEKAKEKKLSDTNLAKTNKRNTVLEKEKVKSPIIKSSDVKDSKINNLSDSGVKSIYKINMKEKPVLRQAKTKNPELEIVSNVDIENTPNVKEFAWQKIMENGTFLIFSAVMDRIYGEPYVKVIAINGNTFLPKFYCEMTYNTSEIVTTKGKIWMLPDHHEKTYKTVFLFCPLPDDEVPVYLSIIPIYKPVRLHRLPVLYYPEVKRNFTVCLSPLFFNHSIEFELVQWFEINRILGIDLFIVYVYSNHPRTDEILRHYENEGWVQIVPWKLPDYTDLHYFGQNAAMNDCMMRNYQISRYMVNIDIDELIVPRRGLNTLMELMSSLPNNFCEYSFRSTFMGEESKDVYDGKQKARELNLYFLLRISRRAYIFDKAVRSKYIVNTSCIDTVGIHYCWKYKNGTIETERYYVAPRDALMYHFRSEPVMKTGKEIEEKAIYKYHRTLIENAKARWEKIKAERLEAKRKAKQKT